jgi:serine/threonine protein phosphatase PrpC
VTVLRSGSATDVGRVRGTNQDLHLVSDSLFAIADGMGGHAGGEVAARDAIEALQRAFRADPSLEGLRHAVFEANTAVWRHSQQANDLRGMGTTLTALALVPDEQGEDVLALANVGDSRAYLYTDGGVAQVTADHSLAEEKVRHGELTEAEAAVHPHRHILTRALGIAPDVEVDVWALRLRTGDRVLLCSDGLSNEVSTEDIGRVLATVLDPTAAAQALVTEANEHGGSDNITVVVVDVMAGGVEDAPSTVAPGYDAAAATALAMPEEMGAGNGGPRPDAEAAGGQAGHESPSVTAPPGAGPPAQGGPGGSEDPNAAVGADRSSSAARGGTATALDTRPATARPGTTTEGDWPATEPAMPAHDEGPPGAGGPAPPRLSRRQQRRQAGIPPTVTVRVVLFVLLLAAVVAAAYGVVRWYATDNWYVTIDGAHLAIYQGRPGGLLWFQPKLVDRTPVTTADVLPIRLPALRGDVEETSLEAARSYVDDLYQEFVSQQQASRPPPTTIPSTTIPSTTTTVPPG